MGQDNSTDRRPVQRGPPQRFFSKDQFPLENSQLLTQSQVRQPVSASLFKRSGPTNNSYLPNQSQYFDSTAPSHPSIPQELPNQSVVLPPIDGSKMFKGSNYNPNGSHNPSFSMNFSTPGNIHPSLRRRRKSKRYGDNASPMALSQLHEHNHGVMKQSGFDVYDSHLDQSYRRPVRFFKLTILGLCWES